MRWAIAAFLTCVLVSAFPVLSASAKQFEYGPGARGETTPLVSSDPIQAPSNDDASSGSDFSQTYIFDLSHLFMSDQYRELTEKAQSLADTYQMGVYVLTTDYMNGLTNPTANQRTAFAIEFYKKYGLGMGSGHDGILLVIASDSRDYVTIAYGQGSYSFDDAGIEKMEDAVVDRLSDNEWYKAADTYYEQIGSQLAYYARHGRPGSPLSIGEWILRIALIVIIPAVIALGVVLKQKRTMKPVRLRNGATEYIDPASVVITAANDTFITTDLVVVPRVSSGSSGGSGSGGWGGGGGGGFSSSGGGKF